MKKLTWTVVVFLSVLTLCSNLGVIRQWKHQQYIYLAQSFLRGKSYFLQIPGSPVDTVVYRGRYYWPVGPLSAMWLTFPVWIWEKTGGLFQQGYVNLFLVFGMWAGATLVAIKSGYRTDDAVWLGTALCFASVFQLSALVPFSWYFLQSLTAFLSVWAVLEWQIYRRYWVVGMLLGMIFWARPTAALGGIFFTGLILTGKEEREGWQAKLLSLWVPVLAAAVMWLGYNQIRFEDWRNFGYVQANVGMSPGRYLLQTGKLFDIRYIPRNLYFYFFNWDPKQVLSFPGTSFFVVSPFFLYIFRSDLTRRMVKLSALTAGMILISLLMYYWPGPLQIGPRYMIDLLPFLYLMLLYSFPGFRLPKTGKIIICVSVIVNIVLWKLLLPVLY
jgi:hypothetical protein